VVEPPTAVAPPADERCPGSPGRRGGSSPANSSTHSLTGRRDQLVDPGENRDWSRLPVRPLRRRH
jgi:hypothetical protein